MWTSRRHTMTAVAAATVLVGLAATTAAVATDESAAGAGGSGVGDRDRCALPGPYELPHDGEPANLHARDFSTHIDNAYWPMRVGTIWRYVSAEAEGSKQKIRVVVTDRTKNVGGIRARVVRDVAREHGELAEKTFDFYAQDSGGSIWYLGENTKSYDDGEVSTEGSWQHGVDGGQAGVALPASPTPGCTYRQEYAEDAKDHGAILSLREDIRIAGVAYRDVLTTSDTTPLERYVVEHKFYGQGVGPVLTIEASPGTEREKLVSMQSGPLISVSQSR